MYNMPFFGFPYYRNYYNMQRNNLKDFQNSNNNQNTLANENNRKTSNDNTNKEFCSNKQNSTTSNNSSSTNTSRGYNDNSQAFINIFGIDLYSDDILILCILLSLYLEGVKDEMLFISLILLLLT